MKDAGNANGWSIPRSAPAPAQASPRHPSAQNEALPLRVAPSLFGAPPRAPKTRLSGSFRDRKASLPASAALFPPVRVRLPPGENGPASGICRTLRGRKIKGLRLHAVPSGSGSAQTWNALLPSGLVPPAPPPGLRGLTGRAKAPRLRGPGATVGSCGPAPRLRGPASGPFSAVPSGVKTAVLPALFTPETAWSFPAFSGHALPPFPPA